MLPTFFINLDRHPDRRCFVEAQLAAASIEAERFQAIDGSVIPPDLADFFPPDTTLQPPQKGCSASHLALMRLIVERNIGAAMVIEDDAVLTPGLRTAIEDVLLALPTGWDVVRLCREPKRLYRPLRALTQPYVLVRYSRIPLGAAGYLVSRQGAEKLLVPRKLYRPNDVEIAHPWLLDLDVYGVVPPPMSQERKALPSTAVSIKRGDLGRLQRAMPDPRRVVFNMRKLGVAWWLRCWWQNAVWRHLARRLATSSPRR